MAKTIYQLVDELPKDDLTVKVLKSLDFVIPGEWTNVVGFEQTIREVTGEEDQDLIQKIGERAITLYNDESQGYKRAMWLYETANKAGSTLGTAAMANKIGQDVGFLGFLTNITPKPDKAQKIDLTFKLIVELLAYCQSMEFQAIVLAISSVHWLTNIRAPQKCEWPRLSVLMG